MHADRARRDPARRCRGAPAISQPDRCAQAKRQDPGRHGPERDAALRRSGQARRDDRGAGAGSGQGRAGRHEDQRRRGLLLHRRPADAHRHASQARGRHRHERLQERCRRVRVPRHPDGGAQRRRFQLLHRAQARQVGATAEDQLRRAVPAVELGAGDGRVCRGHPGPGDGLHQDPYGDRWWPGGAGRGPVLADRRRHRRAAARRHAHRRGDRLRPFRQSDQGRVARRDRAADDQHAADADPAATLQRRDADPGAAAAGRGHQPPHAGGFPRRLRHARTRHEHGAVRAPGRDRRGDGDHGRVRSRRPAPRHASAAGTARRAARGTGRGQGQPVGGQRRHRAAGRRCRPRRLHCTWRRGALRVRVQGNGGSAQPADAPGRQRPGRRRPDHGGDRRWRPVAARGRAL
ncbi:hypothetical protein NB713_001304 [Xanthomonas sacchari]|nr:hypothetical protein [Xanthomonas sacchari]